MIKPPSLSSEYTLIYSGDPALNLPEDPAERERVLALARETGRWTDLIIDGKSPITFSVRAMTGSAFTWLSGESVRRQLTEPEMAALALRLSIRGVVGLGDIKPKRDKATDFWMSTTEIIDAIYALDNGYSMVIELGALLYVKASESPSPK